MIWAMQKRVMAILNYLLDGFTLLWQQQFCHYLRSLYYLPYLFYVFHMLVTSSWSPLSILSTHTDQRVHPQCEKRKERRKGRTGVTTRQWSFTVRIIPQHCIVLCGCHLLPLHSNMDNNCFELYYSVNSLIAVLFMLGIRCNHVIHYSIIIHKIYQPTSHSDDPYLTKFNL